MRRLNWLGVSRCRLLKVDGLDLHVEDLDAVDGTPVLDIKPWFTEFGPAAPSINPPGQPKCSATTSPNTASSAA
jgi:tRNA (Thr-GGU) A37 N-methylase